MLYAKLQRAANNNALTPPWSFAPFDSAAGTIYNNNPQNPKIMEIIKSYEHFASVTAFANALESRPLTISGEKYASYITSCMSEILSFLRDGDAETAAKIKECQKNLKIKGNGEKKSVEVCKSYCGFMPNVGAALAGDPMCMYNVKNNIRRNTKVVNIAVSLTGWHGIDKDMEFAAKYVLLSAIARLELQGYRFNIDCICGGKSLQMNHLVLYSICLKKASQKLNIANVAYLLANCKSWLSGIAYKAKCSKFKFYAANKNQSPAGYILNKNDIRELYPRCGQSKIITLHEIYGKSEDEIIESLTK